MNIREENMFIEDARLHTFERWPSNNELDPREIAKAGFYYLGEDLEVKCFSCGVTISQWDFECDLKTKHETLSNYCKFLREPESSGNLPIRVRSRPHIPVQLTNESRSNNSSTNNDRDSSSASSPVVLPNSNYQLLNLMSEPVRLKTFSNWPVSNIVTPQKLATAGFYYLKQGDQVRCAYCGGSVEKWEVGDDPEREHKRLFPTCRFINSLCPSASNEGTDCPQGVLLREPHKESSSESANLRELGVQSHKIPMHPTFSTVESRLRTFKYWPNGASQKPESLAAAGFYYIGSEDLVKCFHCDGGLKSWDPADDPWKEHARWFSDCGFMMLVKGEEFIKEAVVGKPAVYPNETHNEESGEKEGGGGGGGARDELIVSGNSAQRSASRSAPFQVTDQQLQALMESPQARAVIQIGLEASHVKMAIKSRIEKTGRSYQSSDALAAAALSVQCEQLMQSELEDTWTPEPEPPSRDWWLSRARRSEYLRGNTNRSNHSHSHQISSSPPLSSSSSSSSYSDGPDDSSDSKSISHSETHGNCMEQQISVATSSAESINSLQESNSHDQSRKVSLEEENRQLKEARLCKICMDNEVRIVFLPCGHLVSCVRCAISLPDCPVCRQPIKATVKTFLS